MKEPRRCSICNSVSSQMIETNIGDFCDGHFVTDPKSELHFICEECAHWQVELMSDYYLDDLLNEEAGFNDR